MRSFLTAVLALALVAAPYQVVLASNPDLPFHNYDEIAKAASSGVMPDACPGGLEIVSLTAEVNGVSYWIISSTNRGVIVRYAEDGSPAFVYLLVGTYGSGFTVRKSLTIDEAKALFPNGPCGWLESVEASEK